MSIDIKTIFTLIRIFAIVILLLFSFGCNYSNSDSKNWPPITLVGTLNVEKEVYKLGDTLVFSFIVPDSLPSLTTLGEKVKIHSLNEASLWFYLSEFDTLNKKILQITNVIPVNAISGNIQMRNNTYFIGDFDVRNKPFALSFAIILNKRGLFSIQNGDIRNFIANDGQYKAGLFFKLNTVSKNIHLVNKHFPQIVDSNLDLNFFYAFYVK